MFQRPTTIIVGAGASADLGLPSGDQLKVEIAHLLTPTSDNAYGFRDDTMIEIMKRKCPLIGGGMPKGLREIQSAAARICAGLPLALSIDNFLHAHQGDRAVEEVGKMAIAQCILRAERQSTLFPPSAPLAWAPTDFRPARKAHPTIDNPDLVEKSWYFPFASLLMQLAQKGRPEETFENTRFIIFNYDRCLEQFLWLALQGYFDISEDRAANILANVDFLHPYGSLGPLPWQAVETETTLAFGDTDGADFFQIGAGLKTFTESIMSSIGAGVKDAVSSAHTLLILGFGYLRQNLELLAPDGKKQVQRIISTAYQVSADDREVLTSSLKEFAASIHPMIIVDPVKCRDLFELHRLELSLR